jgi:hypothetical protein
VQQGVSGADLAKLFAPIYEQIQASQEPDAIKSHVTEQVQKVEQEAGKGEQADAEKIEGWLTVIGRMAPDILEVVASTLMNNPVAGIATTVKKIAEKAKAQS